MVKFMGIPKAKTALMPSKQRWAFNVFFSDEAALVPPQGNQNKAAGASPLKQDAMTGLNCAGYGASVCVTAPFGFAAASVLLKLIL